MQKIKDFIYATLFIAVFLFVGSGMLECCVIKLMELVGASYDDVITVGDNVNDYDMIKEFKSYAMESGVQSIKDQLCQDKIDAKNEKIADLERQLVSAQNNAILQKGFSDEVDALYNRLSNCPVPSMPVYGRTPIFTCASQNGCGCGM